MSLFPAAFVRGLSPALLVLLAACSSNPKGSTEGMGSPVCSADDCADAGGGAGANNGGQSAGQSAGQNGNASSGSNNSDGQDAGNPDEVVVDCAKVDVEATLVKKPVDIVWVVDSSPSMDGEAAMVQSNMNAFAASIAASGLDYRVVVITKSGFLTVPDPLGSDAAHFLFVDEGVASHEALDVLINRFDDYSAFLRPDAVTHFVPVTDDEARKEDGTNRNIATRDWFLTEMSRLLHHDFTLHAVASESPKCTGAANAGVIYNLLAAATWGLTFSICSADWSPLFTQLSLAVNQSSGVSCKIPMPEPPAGLTLNPEQVRVGYTESAGAASTPLTRVAGEAACATGGWYFDRPLLPRFISLCPTTCMQVNGSAQAKLNVSVDCGSTSCAGVGVQADVRETPVDIIWVIDSSDSMDNEAKIVQDNLNDFAQDIAASGIDYRVVVITQEDFVYVPEPLRSDTAHLRFIEENVKSREPLDDLLSRFDAYSDFLRPNAVTHIIAVTDDEARLEGGTAALTSTWFNGQMAGKLGHPFTFHAIVSEADVDGKRCSGPNGAAATPGLTYIDLATATKGQFYSICSANWTALFDGLVRAVLSSSPIACEFDLPAAPAGKTFDKDKVNVRYAANGASEVTVIGRTTGADQCQAGGWYYDDVNAPKRIQICESTCSKLRQDFGSAIEIQLGCETKVVIE